MRGYIVGAHCLSLWACSCEFVYLYAYACEHYLTLLVRALDSRVRMVLSKVDAIGFSFAQRRQAPAQCSGLVKALVR